MRPAALPLRHSTWATARWLAWPQRRLRTRLQTSALLVTGTLGLAHPTTAAAMKKAVAVAREGGSKVTGRLSGPAACCLGAGVCGT